MFFCCFLLLLLLIVYIVFVDIVVPVCLFYLFVLLLFFLFWDRNYNLFCFGFLHSNSMWVVKDNFINKIVYQNTDFIVFYLINSKDLQ